jgi:hypothetical protein
MKNKMFLKKLLFSFFSLTLLFFLNSVSAKHHESGEKINPSWMVVDSDNQLVTFTLTSAYNGNNGSWNYNGFYNGSANLVVPQGWNVNLKFVNPDGNYRHSVAVIKMWDGDAPQEADDSLVAIARAYSLSPAQGCLSCKEDVKFKAKNRDDYTIGKYSAFCGVPGHGGSGMWLGFSVIDGIDAPFVMFNESAMDEGYAKPLL